MKNRSVKLVKVVENKLLSITCDVCNREYDVEKDWQETQEFLSIKLEGGFGSIFGDGSEIECDICQYCLKEVLGKHLRIDFDE